MSGFTAFRGRIVRGLPGAVVGFSSRALAQPLRYPPLAPSAVLGINRKLSPRPVWARSSHFPKPFSAHSRSGSTGGSTGGSTVSRAAAELPMEEAQWEHGFVKHGDVDIHYVEAGPKTGELVVLLHGFPSFWYTWKYQIGPLAEQGFHVVAPDLRGYNLSSRPQEVAAYGPEPVLGDVTAIIDHCGGPDAKVVLVGHDWGGAIAWTYAHQQPSRLSRLVIVNVPHPDAFSRALRTDVGQMRRSWYIFAFQLPRLGEALMSVDNFRLLKKVIGEDPVREQSEEHIQRHVAAFSEPGACTGPINFYRAAFRHWLPTKSAQSKIEIPVLVLWGEKDYVFQPYLVEPPKEIVPHSTLVRFPNASHWLMWDEPEAMNEHLLRFIGSETAQAPRSKL